MWIKFIEYMRIIFSRPEVQIALATTIASLISGCKDKIKSWFSKKRIIKKKKK